MIPMKSTKKKNLDWTLAFRLDSRYQGREATQLMEQMISITELMERVMDKTITDDDVMLMNDIVSNVRMHKMKMKLAEEDKRNRSMQRATVLAKLTPEEQIALGFKKGRI